MYKKIFGILMGLILCFGFIGTVNAATLSVVSDTSVEVVGVYNKYVGPTNFVNLSGTPLSAVLAAEPMSYPTVYSVDSLNSVWDNGTGFYFQNTNPGAKWIWETVHAEDPATVYGSSDPLYDPNASSNGRVVVFEKSFNISGVPQDSMLHITADNGYEVWVNGNHIARSTTAKVAGWETTSLNESSLGSSGWQTVGHYSVPASSLINGSNTLVVYAGNEYYSPDNPSFEFNNSPVPPYVSNPYRQQNPGALIFKFDVAYNPVSSLEVTKTVTPSYTRTWKWFIDKTFDGGQDGGSLTLAPGETYPAYYGVEVNASSTDSDWGVEGTITIHNPNDVAAEISDITDSLGTVVCPGEFSDLAGSLAADADLVCTYSGSLPNGNDTTNTATVTTTGDVPGGSDDADVDFNGPTTEVDECVDVTDTFEGSLGTWCAGVDTLPDTFTYERTFGPYEECGDYEVTNTASLVTNDTDSSLEDSLTVDVSVPCTGCTLTQGYWKTHSEKGPAPYDDNWTKLGVLEEETIFFLSGDTWLEVFRTPPKKGNVYYQLAHQYMAAELNALNGAWVPVNVQTALNSAESLFSDKKPEEAALLKGALKLVWTKLAGTLGNYNEGLIGPGHCDEQAYTPV